MPDPFARLLQRLIESGQVPRSQLSARSLKELRSLFDTGVLTQARSGGGLVIRVNDFKTLATFYQQRYPSAEQVFNGPPRANAVVSLRSAKRVGRSNQEPILVRAVHPAACIRDNVQCDLLATTQLSGAACLILEAGRFWSMTAEVAVVENLECFLHFEAMGVAADVVLYAAGRLSELALGWLGSPEMSGCCFIHCGDYDPVGVDEFLRLKRVVEARARLHIPANLRQLVTTYGRPELLRDSEAILKRLRNSGEPDVQRVVQIMDESGLGLEQEALLLQTKRLSEVKLKDGECL
ncbi:MAG: DUF2220 family protein [Kiritimatiellae bacterium]|nr:DUF2220 family protein [Kiritimatiellia bacterium]